MSTNDGLGGLVGVGNTGATNPDGTPNFPVAVGGTVPPKQSIWNLPSDIPNGNKLWYDTTYSSESNSDPTTSPRNRDNFGTHQSGRQVLSTPEQVMAQIAALSANDPQEFMAIQKALGSGAWGSVNPTGAWGPDTETALRRAMSSYWQLSHGAGVGMSFLDYIVRSSASASALAQAGQAPKNTSTPVTDPESIRSAAQAAFQAATGKGASEAQLDHFVTQFQAAQIKAETAMSGAPAAPSLTDQAMSYAQKTDPEGYKTNQRQSFTDLLVNMFAPSASQRPNMTPTPTA